MHKTQFNDKLTYYAKVLVVISIVLLVFGVFLEIRDNHHLINPATDTTFPLEEENFISIDNTEIILGDNSADLSEESSSSNLKVETENDWENLNNILKKQLQDLFEISIYYGKDTEGYSVISDGKKVDTVPLTDSKVIYSQLKCLKNILYLYPPDLFREIKNGGIPLSIYLIDSYSDKSITGITDSNNNYAIISLATIYPIEESFFHESYHYIERYMLKRGVNFINWNSFNPVNFSYGTIYTNLSYSNTFSEKSFFVNNYAQTSPEEDRASTFEYMMAANKAKCLNKKNPVWEKANRIALTIETILNCVRPNYTEHWERYL